MSTTAQSTPGERLRALRLLAGVSAAELARLAGVAGNTILNAERGAVPSPTLQRQITAALSRALSRRVINAEAGVQAAKTDLTAAREQLRAARERLNIAREECAVEIEEEPVWPGVTEDVTEVAA